MAHQYITMAHQYINQDFQSGNSGNQLALLSNHHLGLNYRGGWLGMQGYFDEDAIYIAAEEDSMEKCNAARNAMQRSD